MRNAFSHRLMCWTVTLAGALAAFSWAGTAYASAEEGPSRRQQGGRNRPSSAALSEGEYFGTTRTPALAQLDLSFNGPGLVGEVHVNLGDEVKKGQLLMAQELSVEEERLKFMQEELVTADLEIDAANADLAFKQVRFDEQKRLKRNRDTSKADYEEAEVGVKIAEIKVKAAEQSKKQSEQKIVVQQKEMELKKMHSPISGVVRKIEFGVGEVADPSKAAIVIVNNELLWVEVDLPVEVAKTLELNQELQVRYTDEDQWQTAPVIYFDPVADARSATQRVVMRLENPDNRASGVEVVVKLPENLAAGGDAGGGG